MPVITVTIGGTPVTFDEGSLSITEVINGRGTLRADVRSEDGSLRPLLDIGSEVEIDEDGDTIFGGQINRPHERGLGDIGGVSILTAISATDWNELADRFEIEFEFAGGTLKQLLQQIESELAVLGVTLDPGQVDGPTLEPIPITKIRISDLLNQVSAATGDDYLWEINYDKVLRMYLPGSEMAPFDISSGDVDTVDADITVEKIQNLGANRVTVRFGTGSRLVGFRAQGDGSTTEWEADLPADTSYWPGQVTIIRELGTSAVGFTSVVTFPDDHLIETDAYLRFKNHVGDADFNNGPNPPTVVRHQVVPLTSTTVRSQVSASVSGSGGWTEELVPVGPYEPTFGSSSFYGIQWSPSLHTLYTRPGDDPRPATHAIDIAYRVNFPVDVTIDDVPSQIAEGIREITVLLPNIFDLQTARQAASGYLARGLEDPKIVKYRTTRTGLRVGQVQTITVPERDLSGEFLIVELTTTHVEGLQVVREVTAIGSLKLPLGSWSAVVKNWSGAGSAGGSTVSNETGLEAVPNMAPGQNRQVIYNRMMTLDGADGFEYDYDFTGPRFNDAEHNRARVSIDSGDGFNFTYALALWNSFADTDPDDARETAMTFFVGIDGEMWIRADKHTGTGGGIFGIGTSSEFFSIAGEIISMEPGSIVTEGYTEMNGLTRMGSLSLMRRRETATFTITPTTANRLVYILSHATGATVNLPALANFGVDLDTSDTLPGGGRVYIFHNIGAGAWTLDPNGSETIGPSGTPTYSVSPGNTVAIMGWRGTGSKWIVLWDAAGYGAGGGGGTPGGSDGQVQYNNGGAFGGDAGFVWDDVNKRLEVEQTTAGPGATILAKRNDGVIALMPMNDENYNLGLGIYEDESGDWIPAAANTSYYWSSSGGGGSTGIELVVGESPPTPSVFGDLRGFYLQANGVFSVYQTGGLGVGAFHGCSLEAEHNDDGDGAAGTLRLFDRNGNPYTFWVEAGQFYMSASGRPTEDDSVPHNAGAVFSSSQPSLFTVLTADPGSPTNDTAWVVREGTSPTEVSLKVRIGGTTYVLAGLSIP